MKRAIITGANGYLGQGIVKTILDFGIDVIAVDFEVDQIDDRAERIPCNLFEIKNPYHYLKKPDILLHLAWRDGFIHYADSHINDLPKHDEFIREFAESGISKITVMGSMHEVGFFEGSIREDTPCNPTTPYGISKNALRNLTEMLCNRKNIIFQWMRGYYIVGNSKYGSSIFSKITTAAEEGKKEFPFTMGTNQFDFINYDDFCIQAASVVKQDKINGIINLCVGHPEKLADRVERFIIENKYDIKLLYGAFPERPYDSKAVWGDDAKIKEVLKNA